MNDKLPNVYVNNNAKKIKSNNKEFFYSKYVEKVNTHNDGIDIRRKVNDIFSSSKFVYKANVLIKLKNEILKETIIYRNSYYLLTINGKKIYYENIVDINKI